MLAHRLRRWTNIDPTLVQRLVIAGYSLSPRTKVIIHVYWPYPGSIGIQMKRKELTKAFICL